MNTIKSIFYYILVVIMVILFSGCWRDSTEEKLYGTWEYSYLFSNEYFRKISKEPIPKDIEIDLTIKGVESFHRGGLYNGYAELTMRIKTPKGELPIKFFIKDAGNWSLHNNKEIVATSVDAIFTPVDQISEAFYKESPMLVSLFKPIKGATATSRIMFISDNMIEIQQDGLENIMVMNKKK